MTRPLNPPPSLFRLICRAAFGALLILASSVELQAAPAISSLSLHGLRAGGATTLVIEGTDLEPDPQIVLSAPIAKQEVKQPATATRAEIEVTLDPAIAPGIYQLRVANKRGVSGGVAIGVDSLPQRPFGPEVGELPVALHGSLSGGTILRTSFDGKAGQQVVIDVEAHRLGSKLNPVLHLSDPRHAAIGLVANGFFDCRRCPHRCQAASQRSLHGGTSRRAVSRRGTRFLSAKDWRRAIR